VKAAERRPQELGRQCPVDERSAREAVFDHLFRVSGDQSFAQGLVDSREWVPEGGQAPAWPEIWAITHLALQSRTAPNVPTAPGHERGGLAKDRDLLRVSSFEESASVLATAIAKVNWSVYEIFDLTHRWGVGAVQLARILDIGVLEAKWRQHRADSRIESAVEHEWLARSRRACPRLAEIVPAKLARPTRRAQHEALRHRQRCSKCRQFLQTAVAPEVMVGELEILAPLANQGSEPITLMAPTRPTSSFPGRRITVPAIVLALLATGLAGWLLGGSPSVPFQPSNGSKAAITVPDVVGEQGAQAASQLSGLGFQVATIGLRAPGPVGTVIGQTPARGAQLPTGSVIQIQISEGLAQAVVPDLTRDEPAAARSLLAQVGLGYQAGPEESSESVPAGLVLRTLPTAGSLEPRGSSVMLIISSGPPEVVVPRTTGLSLSDAESVLKAVGLEYQVKVGSQAGAKAGSVISQDPVAAASVPAGSVVALTVDGIPTVPASTTTVRGSSTTSVSSSTSTTATGGSTTTAGPGSSTSTSTAGTTTTMVSSSSTTSVSVPVSTSVSTSSTSTTASSVGLHL
jgi:beta-lactam-binding protein with PASTA domain